MEPAQGGGMKAIEFNINKTNSLKHGIGVNIKKMREARGLTQWELARVLGCGRANLAMIEIGKSLLTLIMLYKLVEIFHCSIFDILPEKIAKKKGES
jgi:transcriptional regulator with XRE-family HTH domain